LPLSGSRLALFPERFPGRPGPDIANQEGVLKVTTQEVLSTFTRILRDVLFEDSIELTMETRREDIPEWDSFNYINFIVAVESQFGVKFKIADIESFPDVGAIVTEVMKILARSRPAATTLERQDP
jgi:acyl carrier protein